MRSCRLFFFVDALGAQVLAEQKAFAGFGLVRPLRSVLGYSSACIPTILSGRLPQDHLHWSFFERAGAHPGLKVPWWIRSLPRLVRDRGRIRSRLSASIARANRITGYFQVYQMPLAELWRYGHCEPRNIFSPGGLNAGANLADLVQARRLPAWIADPQQSPESSWARLLDCARDPGMRLLFMYEGRLDAWLHDHTRQDPGLDAQLVSLSRRIQTAIQAAQQAHDQVYWYIFSDHGMCTVTRHLDVFPVLATTGLRMHSDYQCVIDSTMVRLWADDTQRRLRLLDALAGVPGLHRLDPDDLAREGLDFPDDRFGQEILLSDPGVLLVPSHMGTVPLRGMHGYTPAHPDSDAAFLTNDPEAQPDHLADLLTLMMSA